MKQQADKRRTEREFEVGDWVYLKLQHYRHSSIALRKNLKLCAKYYGPFQVLQRIGQIAYKLLVPLTTNVHPIFHVSRLKKNVEDIITV